MGVKVATNHSKKRKQVNEDDAKPVTLFEAENLEMLSDEEDGEDAGSDDGHVDEFPEIDPGSDSEDGSVEVADDDDDSGSEDEDEVDEDGSLDSDLDSDDDRHIFPQAKTIISDITGQEKRVYPEIEPEYDSDSSTEDVWLVLSLLRRT
jgi:ribosome biogenesis protein ERB1